MSAASRTASAATLLLSLLLGACAGPGVRDGDSSAIDPPPVVPMEPVEPGDPPVATPVDPLDDPAWRRTETRGGGYVVLWKAAEGTVPKNEHFELDVIVFKQEAGLLAPLEGANLAFSGWMPDHGHGMIRRPQARDVGEGRYRVRGMLFHMGGFWQFFIDVIDGSHSERAQFDLLL